MADQDEQAALIAGGSSAVALAAGESVGSENFDLKHLVETLPRRDVPIGSLTPGFYLRQDGTNPVHVQLLVGVAGSAQLPPILVQERGWRVIDGMHRLAAARLRGDDSIAACFFDCSDEEALVLAIKSNTLHGLPLSKVDRISGAKRVLADHPDWSDRAVASIAGLSAKTIASLRNRRTDEVQPSPKRLGRDGRRRPVVAGEGRRRAAEYIHAHPDAPLRQVAKEADVSLGTVHDVRSRIRGGADQDRNRHRLPHARVAELQNNADPPRSEASVSGIPLQRNKRANVPPAWSGLSAKLSNDPAIRYTEGGKEFLRWMAMCAPHADDWREFIDAIPVHWSSAVAAIAESVSEEWSEFADRLRCRQEAAS